MHLSVVFLIERPPAARSDPRTRASCSTKPAAPRVGIRRSRRCRARTHSRPPRDLLTKPVFLLFCIAAATSSRTNRVPKQRTPRRQSPSLRCVRSRAAAPYPAPCTPQGRSLGWRLRPRARRTSHIPRFPRRASSPRRLPLSRPNPHGPKDALASGFDYRDGGARGGSPRYDIVGTAPAHPQSGLARTDERND